MSAARGVVAALLAGQAGFQLGLASGRPWGPMAYGGAHPSVLPARLRRVSAGAGVVYAGAAVAAAAAPLGPTTRRRAATTLTALAVAAAGVNGASPSRPERVWAAWALALAAASWRAR